MILWLICYIDCREGLRLIITRFTPISYIATSQEVIHQCRLPHIQSSLVMDKLERLEPKFVWNGRTLRIFFGHTKTFPTFFDDEFLINIFLQRAPELGYLSARFGHVLFLSLSYYKMKKCELYSTLSWHIHADTRPHKYVLRNSWRDSSFPRWYVSK